MFSRRRVVWSTALVLLLAAVCLRVVRSQEIKYSQDPDAEKRMALLLKDFDPHSMAHLAVHEVTRARFPVIDVHNHVNDAAGIHGKQIAAADVVRLMDPREPQEDCDPHGDVGRQIAGRARQNGEAVSGPFCSFHSGRLEQD